LGVRLVAGVLDERGELGVGHGGGGDPERADRHRPDRALAVRLERVLVVAAHTERAALQRHHPAQPPPLPPRDDPLPVPALPAAGSTAALTHPIPPVPTPPSVGPPRAARVSGGTRTPGRSPSLH